MNAELITVQCDELLYVNWLNQNSNFDIESGTVTIWRLPLTTNHDNTVKLLPVLNEAEKVRASKYLRYHDSKRYILTRATLKLLLAKVTGQSPTNIQLSYGADKKPFLQIDRHKPLHFNVSHSGDYALIALADQQVGVDIEQLNPDIKYKDILDHYFSPKEIQHIVNDPLPLIIFYKFWTRKEALLKATGKGIIDALSGIGVLNGANQFRGDLINSERDWRVTSFPVAEGSAGSIANLSGKFHFLDLELEKLIADSQLSEWLMKSI